MVFAAGKGSRLGALTADRPKALVEIGGVTLLELVLCRLRDAGVREVIINTHHFGELIEAFVARHGAFGLKVAFSREKELLDTGGGLKHAAAFFAGDAPFFVHNVDVLSDIDLGAMMRAHHASGALATLAAKSRPTARPLLFDRTGQLCGQVGPAGERVVYGDGAELERLGFCGIHVISPALLGRLTETGPFSIVTSYLRLAGAGALIRAHRVDAFRWRDCGRPEDLGPW